MGLGLDKNPAHRTEKGLTANEPIAAMLREMADLLEQQEADGFRTAAYRQAAQTIDALEMPVEELARKEREGCQLSMSCPA